MKVFLWLSFFALAQQSQAGLNPVIDAEDRLEVNSQALITASHSSKILDRLDAAYAYGRIQNPGGIDPLLTLLQDQDDRVREAATFNLGQFGWDTKFAGGREAEIVGELLPLLNDSNDKIRVAALEAIGKLALESTPALVTASLSDPIAPVRAEAAMALYRYHLLFQTKNPGSQAQDVSQDTLRALLSLVHDKAEAPRRNVAFYFSSIQDHRGFDAIAELAQDSDVWTRYFATVALGKQGDPRAVDQLSGLTQDSEYTIRVAAIHSLAALKSLQEVSSSTVSLLETDPVVHVREALAGALGRGSNSEAAISFLLGDSSDAVRVAALQSWARLKKNQAEPDISASLGDPSWVIRQGAADSASELGSAGESLLLEASRDSDVRVRDSGIAGLGLIKTEAAFKAIRAAALSDQLSERFTAVDALQGRTESGVSDLVWQIYQQSMGNSAGETFKWNGVREEAVNILAPMPGSQVTAELQQALADPDPVVVENAIQALKSRGITDLPPALEVGLTFSPYRELHFKANPLVILDTTRGQIVIECYPKSAPIHVANFVGFAQAGGYDGLPWHRVVSDFVIQGGDPDRTGFGDAGYSLRAEINSLRFDRGSVGMPRSDDFNTGGVQLFITHVPTPSLDGRYTVFGKVIQGLDVVDQIEVGDLILHASVSN
jgi:cyclophilin family peptidyl-prolyl cis-trans isomerase/HEAT repeat protein